MDRSPTLRRCRGLFPLLTLPLLVLALWVPSQPAMAAAKPHQLTPSGWPVSVWTPAAGQLQVAGQNGVKAETLDGDDFVWFNPLMLKLDGAIYNIDGAHEPLDASDPGVDPWKDFADGYKNDLESDKNVKVADIDMQAKFGGRRWVRFDVQKQDPDEGTVITYSSFATLQGSTVYYVDINYNSPPADDIDGQIAIILGGPNAAQ